MARITDDEVVKEIQKELQRLISLSETFSKTLRKTLETHDIDIKKERKATVEVLRIILQRWSVEIIHTLYMEGPSRFNDLMRQLDGISSRTLAGKLRTLENERFVKREVLNKRPIIVNYSLTEKGQIFASLSAPVILYLKFETRRT